MRGLADGSGISMKFLRRFHMIGELTKGTCSMFGAWGKATADSKLIQLRSLDWVTVMKYRQSMGPLETILWLLFIILHRANMDSLG